MTSVRANPPTSIHGRTRRTTRPTAGCGPGPTSRAACSASLQYSASRACADSSPFASRVLSPADEIVEGNAARPIRVRRMFGVGVPERDTAKDPAAFGKFEIFAQQRRTHRKRGLRDRSQSETLSREQERVDEEPAVDRAIHTKFGFGGEDCDVGCAEEFEVLERLRGRSVAVTAHDTEAVIQLPTAPATAFLIDPVVAGREVEVGAELLDIGSDRLAQVVGALSFGDDDLPWLGVAPRRRAAGHGQQAFDHGPVDLAVEEAATTPSVREQSFEISGAFGHACYFPVKSGWRFCRKAVAPSTQSTDSISSI